MPASIKTTDHDHIPEDFTLESLSQTLTPEEVQALMGGDDPILQAMNDGEAPPADQPPAQQQPTAQDQQQPPAQQQQQAPQPPAVDPAKVAAAKQTLSTSEQTIAQLDTQLNQLMERYDIGEITRETLMAEQRKLTQQQAQIQAQVVQAQQVIQSEAEARNQQWFSTLEQWRAQKGADFLWSQENLEGWNNALITVNSTPAYQVLDHTRRIELAFELLNANTKALTGKPLPPLKADAPGGQTQPKGEPRTDEREPLQTLSGFNTDAQNAITDGTFAAIDRLMETDPIAAEKALMKLPQEMRDAFLEV